jgi:hypothetical protein
MVVVVSADDQDAYGWVRLGVPLNAPGCVQCGACCQTTTLVHGHAVVVRCEHLIVIGAIGEPYATYCAVHHSRRNGDPIVMRTLTLGFELRGATCGERPCVRASTTERGE